MPRMWGVVAIATSIAVVCYAFAGFLGYATFVNNPDVAEIMEVENIFEAPYMGDEWIIAGSLILLAGVVLASPLCLMPAKDTIEELFLGQERRMTSGENFLCTFSVISICFLAAVCIPDISDAMTVIGATSNPAVGFCLPIIYWLKMDQSPACSPKRLAAHFINVFVILTGLLSLYNFVLVKIDEAEE